MRSANKPIVEQAFGKTSAAEPVSQDTDGLEEARIALEGALEKKALEPVLLDVRGLCSYTSYILVVSGRSDRQVDAIGDGILATMREHGIHSLGVEGKGSGPWILLDFGDCVAHVFHHPIRDYYDLEGLWIDAQRVPIEVPDEARIAAEDDY